MDDNSENVTQEATGAAKSSAMVNTAKVIQSAAVAPKYTKAELIEGFKAFDTQPECVAAALSVAGVAEATEEEAKKIISDFLKREVKK